MAEKRNIRGYLNQEFSRRRRVNPRYSIRAFAAYLNISPSFLSEILRGKRSISQIMLLKIGNRLKLNMTHLETFKSSLTKIRRLNRRRKTGLFVL